MIEKDPRAEGPDGLDDIKLQAIVKAEILDAIGFLGSEINQRRETLLNEYEGKKYGNEQEGRSSYVSRDAFEAIEGVMPSLMRVFTSGDKVVEFEPVDQSDEEQAKLKTEYINHVVMNDNEGFPLLYCWFKDALQQINGYVKIWWDEQEEEKTIEYEGQTQEQRDIILMELEGEEAYNVEESVRMSNPIPDPAFPESAEPVPLYDLRITCKKIVGKLKIDNVPPEEVLISRRAKSLEEASFVAHRSKRTVSDLVADGYDYDHMVRLSSEDDAFEELTVNRHQGEDGIMGSVTYDDSMRKVDWIECYIRVDVDGDGIAELNKITCGGPEYEIVGEPELIDEVPLVSLTPILQPHKHFGKALIEVVQDIQNLKTTVIRQLLDNLYLANCPQKLVNPNMVDNLDQLLDMRPGATTLVQDVDRAVRYNTHPDITPTALTAIEYLDGVKENRAGVTRYNQGLDADSLNKTASGINQIMSAAQQRIELIARVFAETGIKKLFQKALKIIRRHQDYERMVRFAGTWVPVNPTEWTDTLDMSVQVGIGTGNKDQQLGHLLNLYQMQLQLMSMGLVGPAELYKTVEKIIENMGFKSAEGFLIQPGGEDGKPPFQMPPNPEAVKAETDAALKQEELALKREQMERDYTLEERKIESQHALKLAEIQLRYAQPPVMEAGFGY